MKGTVWSVSDLPLNNVRTYNDRDTLARTVKEKNIVSILFRVCEGEVGGERTWRGWTSGLAAYTCLCVCFLRPSWRTCWSGVPGVGLCSRVFVYEGRENTRTKKRLKNKMDRARERERERERERCIYKYVDEDCHLHTKKYSYIEFYVKKRQWKTNVLTEWLITSKHSRK